MIPEHPVMLWHMDGSNWGDDPHRYWYRDENPQTVPQQERPPRDLKSFFAGDRRKAVRWSAGIAAAAVVAGGAAIAGVAVADHGSQPPNQGTALSAAVDTAASPSPGTAGAKAGARKRALARLRALRGIHGQVTLRTKKGFRELAWERGTIQSASSKNVVVRSADGTTWVWNLASKTAVRDQGKKGSTSDLAGGDRVFVAGPETGGARTARVIIIPKAASGSSSSSNGTASPSTSS
jgi:hypothetical protein